MRRGRHQHYAQPVTLDVAAYHLRQLTRVRYVDLVQRDDPWTVSQPSVRTELALDHVQIVDRVPPGFGGRAVHDVHQGRTTLDVPQEVMTEPLPPTRALD